MHVLRSDIPANAGIVLEGTWKQGVVVEGSYGDHTSYYNETDTFLPVFSITHITQCCDPLYYSTYTGRRQMNRLL